MNPYNPIFWAFILILIGFVLWVLLRPFSTTMRFVYPTAKYEAMGNPFIQKQQLEALMDARNLSSLIETINSKKNIILEGTSSVEVHASLEKEWLNTITMMKQDTSSSVHQFFDAFLMQKDLELLAYELKQKLVNMESTQEIHASIAWIKKVIIDLRESDREHLQEVLQHHGFSDEILNELSSETPRFVMLDVLLYQQGITWLQQIKVPYKVDEPKQRIVKTLLDMTNIKMALRAKQRQYNQELCLLLFVGEGRELPQWKFAELCATDSPKQLIQQLEGTAYYPYLQQALPDYEKNSSIQWFEIALDRYLLQVVREISTQYYTYFGPLLRFLFSRQFELQNLRVIVKGITEQLSTQEITPLLVWEETT